MLKIGVIVHGPTIIDSGYAIKIIEQLSKYGKITARLGGTMGRTAVLDANAEDIINIEDKLLPSESIKLLAETNDVLFLLNSGKSTLTGHTFGYKVLNKIENPVNIIQIERPAYDDGVIIQWNKQTDKKLLKNISNDFNLPIIDSKEAMKIAQKNTGYTDDNNIIRRKVAGVSKNENIMLNGIIIGRVTDDNLTIIAENDKIIDMEGGIIKQHGLEKLGPIDLKTAIIKTGLLRRNNNIKPRQIKHTPNKQLKAVYLNHAACDIYDFKDADIICSIGDDTTLLTSDILYRFNIPIIGITDGDLDRVVLEGFKHPDSTIIQLQHGYDDKIGHLIYDEIFKNNTIITIESLDEFIKSIIQLIDKTDVEYKFVDKQLENIIDEKQIS